MRFGDLSQAVEVSVVIPCLNEQDTLARCLEKVRRWRFSVGAASCLPQSGNGGSLTLAIWITLARCDWLYLAQRSSPLAFKQSSLVFSSAFLACAENESVSADPLPSMRLSLQLHSRSAKSLTNE